MFLKNGDGRRRQQGVDALRSPIRSKRLDIRTSSVCPDGRLVLSFGWFLRKDAFGERSVAHDQAAACST